MIHIKLFEAFQDTAPELEEFLKKWPPAFEVLSHESHGEEEKLQEYIKDLQKLSGIESECVVYDSGYEVNFYDIELMQKVHPTRAVIKTFKMGIDEANRQLKPFGLKIPKYTEY